MLDPRGTAGRASHDPLVALARATTRPEVRWHAGRPWHEARNAHETNSAKTLVHALRSDANWLEGDLRRDAAGRLVMAHDAHDVGWGVSFERWLAIGAASGRGVKVDLKDAAAFDAMLDAIEASGIDPSRLILNVPVAGPPERALVDSQLRRLRRRFPRATANLYPTGQVTAMSPAVIAELARAARIVGGSVMFPLQWDLLRDDAIRALRPFGKIAVWSSPVWGTPADAAREAAALRLRGVDGMIDLAPAGCAVRLLSIPIRALGAVFGRQAVMDARDGVTRLFG